MVPEVIGFPAVGYHPKSVTHLFLVQLAERARPVDPAVHRVSFSWTWRPAEMTDGARGARLDLFYEAVRHLLEGRAAEGFFYLPLEEVPSAELGDSYKLAAREEISPGRYGEEAAAASAR